MEERPQNGTMPNGARCQIDHKEQYHQCVLRQSERLCSEARPLPFGAFAEHCTYDEHKQTIEIYRHVIDSIVVEKERLEIHLDEEDADVIKHSAPRYRLPTSPSVQRGKYPFACQCQQHIGEQKPCLLVPGSTKCTDVFQCRYPTTRVTVGVKPASNGEEYQQREPIEFVKF